MRCGPHDIGVSMVVERGLARCPRCVAVADYVFVETSQRLGLDLVEVARVHFRLGERLHVRPGTAHDWWNAGDTVAHVLLEVEPAARFEAAIRNGFGLAQDGRTDARGMPGLLQMAVFALEFDDVIRFTWPPQIVQRLLFTVLAPLARLAGYKGSYPEYLTRPAREVVVVEFGKVCPQYKRQPANDRGRASFPGLPQCRAVRSGSGRLRRRRARARDGRGGCGRTRRSPRYRPGECRP